MAMVVSVFHQIAMFIFESSGNMNHVLVVQLIFLFVLGPNMLVDDYNTSFASHSPYHTKRMAFTCFVSLS